MKLAASLKCSWVLAVLLSCSSRRVITVDGLRTPSRKNLPLRQWTSQPSNHLSYQSRPKRRWPQRRFDSTVHQLSRSSSSLAETGEVFDVVDSPRGGAQPPSASPTVYQELAAECFGTFLIVQIGTASVMSSIFTGSLTGGLLPIALLWGFAVTLAILCTGPISGAHLNPAISLALTCWRGFQPRKLVPYVLAQVSGAVLGAAVNLGLYSSAIQSYESSHKLVRATSVASAKAFGEYFDCSIATAWGTEALGTAVLAAAIFALTHPRRSGKDAPGVPIPVTVGATVGTLICILAPITQCGLNPARDWGPRIVAYLGGWTTVAWRHWWVYVTAPLVGAVCGGWIVDKLLYREASV